MIHQAKQKGRIMKRRMIAVLLSGILLCSAAGCGKEAVTDKSTAASSSQEVTETPAAEESPEASSSSADSTAESASASTSSESSGDEGKEADKKRIEITVPHKDGMEALYDTVDGLNVEKGSYIAVVAKDLSAGFWKAVKAGAQQALDDLNASLGYTGNDKVYMTFEGPENESDTNSQINIIDSVISENPDALILGIIDQQSGQAQMEEASDSQIPVVIADSGIESDLITSTCATDHAAAAKLAADHLCEAIGNSGEVAIVAHQYNTESSVERVEAFKKEIDGFSDEAYQLLKQYNWPGNVRELQHVIERAVILSETRQLQYDDFMLRLPVSNSQDKEGKFNLEELEKNTIQEVLRHCSGNMTQAASLLGITRTSLYRRLEKYSL